MQNEVGISGTTGFVGINLVPYLEKRKCTIYGINREPKKNEISYSELSDEYWNNLDAFVHLAGKAHDLKKVSSEEDYFTINRDLTIQLFDAFLKSSCRTFVFISSVKAVRDSLDEVLTESHEAKPTTPYGRSKLEAENYIRSHKIPASKRVYILRPCMIHGPFNKGNLNVLYTFINKGTPYPFGAYKNQRSFVSVENLLFVIYYLIEKNSIESGIYNIADDQSISSNKLVNLIGEVLNKKPVILNIPKFFIKFIGLLGDIISFIPLNSERIEKLTENYRVSNEKIKTAIGIHKMPIDAFLGMKTTIKSFED
jgi:nucleoside-diphosphate-sugar epimerase